MSKRISDELDSDLNGMALADSHEARVERLLAQIVRELRDLRGVEPGGNPEPLPRRDNKKPIPPRGGGGMIPRGVRG